MGHEIIIPHRHLTSLQNVTYVWPLIPVILLTTAIDIMTFYQIVQELQYCLFLWRGNFCVHYKNCTYDLQSCKMSRIREPSRLKDVLANIGKATTAYKS